MLDHNDEWLHAVQTGVWHALVSYKELVLQDNEKTLLGRVGLKLLLILYYIVVHSFCCSSL